MSSNIFYFSILSAALVLSVMGLLFAAAMHTMFRVPPLTLQPIVENAVKHGRDPYAGAFHVSVRTRKTDSGSEIVIADNDRGFAPTEDSDGHLALNNIRQRLEMMCGGSLTITPNDGGGTVVTVTIPNRAAE